MVQTAESDIIAPTVSKLHWSLDPAEDPLAVFNYAATTRESKRACSPLVFRSSLLDEAVTELPQRARQAHHEELLADVAAALLHQRDELVGDFLGAEGVLAVLDPLGEEGLDFGASAVAFVLRFAIGMSTGHSFTFLHNALHAVAHLADYALK